MTAGLIPIDAAAKAVPCSEDTLRKWLRQGHIQGRDSFGRRDRQITDVSTGIEIDVDSLRAYCGKIGITPNLGRRGSS